MWFDSLGAVDEFAGSNRDGGTAAPVIDLPGPPAKLGRGRFTRWLIRSSAVEVHALVRP
jgi:hypothetical protein